MGGFIDDLLVSGEDNWQTAHVTGALHVVLATESVHAGTSFSEVAGKHLDVGNRFDVVDTGGVLAQRQMHVGTDETLRTSYEKLTEAIEDLFVEIWPGVKAGEQQAEEQPLGGSYHRLADKEPFVRLLRNGWDPPVAELVGKAKAPRLREVVS